MLLNMSNNTVNLAQPCMSHHCANAVRPLRRAFRWAPMLACMAISACASLGTGAPEAQVRQRATERWKALLVNDFNTAYTYSTAGFKSAVTPDGFRSRVGTSVTWLGTEVVGVKCPEPAKCTATVRIDFKALMGGKSGDPFNTHIDETWLLENGKWWIFQAI